MPVRERGYDQVAAMPEGIGPVRQQNIYQGD